jgi:hypothetical protein
MSVYVYSMFVLSCVQVEALWRADPPSKESYWLCIGLRISKSLIKGSRAIYINNYKTQISETYLRQNLMNGKILIVNCRGLLYYVIL